MFLSLDGTFWIQLVNFAIFFAILNVVFLKPVGEAIRKRREYIDGVQADYERYTRQVTTFEDEAEAKRSQARREGEELIARARSSAEERATRLISTRTEEAQAISELARATVAGEVATAKLREEEIAASLAGKLVERAVGSAR